MNPESSIENPMRLLGKASDSEAFQRVFNDFGVPTAPKTEPDEPQPVRFWLPIRRLGIEFGFTEANYHSAEEPEEDADQVLVCTTIYFYNWPSSGISKYLGALPHDLSFTMTRPEVQEFMAEKGLDASSYERDVYQEDGRLCIVSYTPKEDGITDVIVRIPDKPFPPSGAKIPAFHDIIPLFGLSVRDPKFTEAFKDFDLESHLEELKDEREISLRRKAGIDLVFSWGRLLNLKRPSHGLVFAGARFYRAREQNAVEWEGLLPAGLTFDASPQTVLDAFGRTPDTHREDDQSGFFVWKGKDWTAHVRFNKVENTIRRFSLYAPGYWESRSVASLVEGRRNQ